MRTKKRLRVLAVAVAAIVLMPPLAVAQTTGGLNEQISVSYVMVPFSAYDSSRRPIRDLRPTQVSVLVDGRQVRTDLFSKIQNEPVSFTILLDASGSMGLAGKFEGAKEAIDQLLHRAVKGDDYALYVFAEGKVREVVSFTTNGNAIRNALNQVKPFGETALYDALLKMPDKTILGRNGARMIFLLTDGIDNASKSDLKTYSKVFQGVDVPVYPVALQRAIGTGKRSREAGVDITVLASLAGTSGGRMVIASEPREFKEAVESILREIRAQYLVGFAPTGRGEIRYRQISLRFARSVQSVRVRAGYRGSEPPYLGRK